MGVLEASWLQVGKSWGHLGSSWRGLEVILVTAGGVSRPTGLQVGGLGAILAPTWEVLGPSWLQLWGLGGSWAPCWEVGGPCLGSFRHHVASLSIYQKPSKFADFHWFLKG